jgi:hypothetical protein
LSIGVAFRTHDVDRYERKLRLVTVNGRSVGIYLIEEGLAFRGRGDGSIGAVRKRAVLLSMVDDVGRSCRGLLKSPPLLTLTAGGQLALRICQLVAE